MGLAQRRTHTGVMKVVLIKAAAVRETGEGAGDEVWIIRVAETAEHLVFFAKVLVNADVELLGVVSNHGVSREIIEDARRGRAGI